LADSDSFHYTFSIFYTISIFSSICYYSNSDASTLFKNYGFFELPPESKEVAKVAQLRYDFPSPDPSHPFFFPKKLLLENYPTLEITDRGISQVSLNVLKLILTEDPSIEFERLRGLVGKEEVTISQENDEAAKKYIGNLCRKQLTILNGLTGSARTDLNLFQFDSLFVTAFDDLRSIIFRFVSF